MQREILIEARLLQLDAGAAPELPGDALHALYVAEGQLAALGAGEAAFVDAAACLQAVEPSLLWLFSVSRGRLTAGADTGVFSAMVKLPEGAETLVRLDRIELPPGTVTPRHRHRGPGIRAVLSGSVDAMVGPRRFPVATGEAWLETPGDDIIGRADATLGTGFVRLMLLPADLVGGATSFVAVPPRPDDPPSPVFERRQTILLERLSRL
ncbi:cupin domain-containing protein [Marinimicrococcus flavescens]|uniref:Cupin domain-containing protein n=1 Tax=Marinimicrococcus flavescens TaxID=3031815 RepID=A0AAP3UX79_9PROT|nr:cupin domain-containing protein [Marinimicrococcus flavescens]